MTGKTKMADGEDAGLRAQHARKKRLLAFWGIYAVGAAVLLAGLTVGRRSPEVGFPIFTPEAGIAGAILLPLLTLVSMWFALRILDEVQRQVAIHAWAASFIVTIFGVVAWFFLIAGGVVPEPHARTVLIALLAGGGASVLVAAIFLRWRRFGDFGAV